MTNQLIAPSSMVLSVLISYLAFVLQDIAQRIQFTLPGYLSSGGTPCSFDALTETELHHFGKKSKQIGIPGMMRCYLERIRKYHLHH